MCLNVVKQVVNTTVKYVESKSKSKFKLIKWLNKQIATSLK